MANRLQIKRNVYGTGGAPAANSLLTGELAWDAVNEKLYIGKQTANNGNAQDVTVTELNSIFTADVPIATSSSVGTVKIDTTDFNITGAGALSLATTSTAAELNILDGATLDTAELNKLDGVTASTAELNYVDVASVGTVEATKAVVVDSNKDISGFRNVTIAGNLTVQGTTTTVDSDNLTVKDKNIVVASNVSGNPASEAGVNGAGITVGTNASAPSLTWNNGGSVDYFEFNKPFKVTIAADTDTGSSLDFGTYAT